MTSKPLPSLGNPRLGLGSDLQGLMSIGDMARTFNVSQRTLRFYEDRGLLSPRRDGSTRLYGASERQRLDMILRAKRLGFTLTEIIRFAARNCRLRKPVSPDPDSANSYTCPTRRHVAREHQQAYTSADTQDAKQIDFASISRIDHSFRHARPLGCTVSRWAD